VDLVTDGVGDGREAGPHDIAVVWQVLALCDNLSTVANLFLGNERVHRRLLDEATMAREGRRLLARLRISIDDPLAPVATLSGGQRQLVAIARAVLRDPSLLVLDEPTAALGVSESRVVERLIGRLRASGSSILLVSHRLDQVFNVADRIAEEFGVQRATVFSFLRRVGAQTRYRILSDDDVAIAQPMYEAGQSLAVIAEHFGVADRTVLTFFRRTGVPTRGPGTNQWSTNIPESHHHDRLLDTDTPSRGATPAAAWTREALSQRPFGDGRKPDGRERA
jgi:ABC-type nitrate/sulfonate/bicarbonate transport system ATPase subunit